MPKASLQGIGQKSRSISSFNEGFGEITAANVSVFQLSPNKKTGQQSDPFVSVNLTLQRINAEGEPVGDEVFVEHFGAGSIHGGQCPVHVGLAKDANDDEPADMGVELDSSEGNTFWVPEGGTEINENTKYRALTDSLVSAGLDAAVIHNAFIPDLIGLKAYFKTESRKLNNGNTASYLVVEKGKIIAYPYEAKGGAAKPKATAKAGQPNGVAANGDSLAAGQAEALVEHIAKLNPGKTIARANFNSRVTMLTAKWEKSQQQHVQRLLKDDAWVGNALANVNSEMAGDQVTFGVVTY